jgi:hypothetical protein
MWKTKNKKSADVFPTPAPSKKHTISIKVGNVAVRTVVGVQVE